jgi:type I restriction enzyme M protein
LTSTVGWVDAANLTKCVLTPGRYVGAEEVEDDDEAFEEKMLHLTQKLEQQFEESARLEKIIRANLARIINFD